MARNPCPILALRIALLVESSLARRMLDTLSTRGAAMTTRKREGDLLGTTLPLMGAAIALVVVLGAMFVVPSVPAFRLDEGAAMIALGLFTYAGLAVLLVAFSVALHLSSARSDHHPPGGR